MRGAEDQGGQNEGVTAMGIRMKHGTAILQDPTCHLPFASAITQPLIFLPRRHARV